MNYNITFQERTTLAMMHLSKQLPVSLEQAKKQAKQIKENTKTKKKKQRI